MSVNNTGEGYLDTPSHTNACMQRMRYDVGNKAPHRALLSGRDDLPANSLIELGIVVEQRDGGGQRLGIGMRGDDS
jgi:hypothetical protein